MQRDPILAALAKRLDVQLPEYSEDPYTMGLDNSGTPQTLLSVSPPQVVKPVSLLQRLDRQPCTNLGMATVHVSVADASGRTLSVPSNQRVQLAVSWQTGRAGGAAVVDATQGAIFTVNGTSTITVQATLVSNAISPTTGLPVAFVAGQDKSCEASVQWGDATFQPAFCSVGSIALTANNASIPLPIPQQARAVQVYTDQPTANVNFQCLMPGTTAANIAAGVGLLHSASFGHTTAVSMPIVNGAELFSLTSSADCNGIAVFELWL